ncbi:MAG: (Fe-S)-binding protein [Thermoguttaceae bacterium]
MVTSNIELPGLNCGLCGYRSCDEFRNHLATSPDSIRRCIHLSKDRVSSDAPTAQPTIAMPQAAACPTACGGCGSQVTMSRTAPQAPGQLPWKDSLGRDFDFYLEHFPEDPGPREIILPHNPIITRELDVQVGDILIGRPLGMSCGCPITHCGVATQVDMRTGVIVWCVTGPLGPRTKGFKDLGYYIAEGYEGLVKNTRSELKVGMRYYFQPHMCMLQWRHSGLLNYLNRDGDQWQVRLEGLWIG